jgi:hypothetical protein
MFPYDATRGAYCAPRSRLLLHGPIDCFNVFFLESVDCVNRRHKQFSTVPV